ncbi:MAG: hypothetical protein P4L36_20325 [Holophaga sp.]|nr:hypothetical protein [Holophaga sp.]
MQLRNPPKPKESPEPLAACPAGQWQKLPFQVHTGLRQDERDLDPVRVRPGQAGFQAGFGQHERNRVSKLFLDHRLDPAKAAQGLMEAGLKTRPGVLAPALLGGAMAKTIRLHQLGTQTEDAGQHQHPLPTEHGQTEKKPRLAMEQFPAWNCRQAPRQPFRADASEAQDQSGDRLPTVATVPLHPSAI